MTRAAFLILSLTAPVAAQTGMQPAAEAPAGTPAALRGIGIDQRLDEAVPADIPFRDEAGRTVLLGDYFQDKPVILVLAYFRCPMLCTQVLNGLVEALRAVPFSAGEDFQVVVVSFDARETPELAAAKKESYVASYGKPGTAGGWHFLTGEQAAIDRVAEAIGFRYSFNADTDQFAHASGIVLLTPQGRTSRYFYGIHYSVRDLRLGLVEASHDRIGSPVDQILLYCFHYDAAAGKYSATIRNAVRAGGILTLAALGAFVVSSWRRDRKKAKLNPVLGKGA